ncbi:MAG TPA: sulfite exporter TauE/SafE family protein, partial [Balneolaceae bacterium]|nr:sulfite exporter TauE/SafE family protein [Balneolaceae bacterium]
KAESTDAGNPSSQKLLTLCFSGFGVGLACGFFAIGGGFMIIPAIMLTADFSLLEAIATGLLPFGLFSLWIGSEYWVNNSAQVVPALYIMTTGIIGGISGIWLSKHISKQKMQRLFAVFMLILGVYMILQ